MKLKKGTGIRESNPTEELLDEELIGRAAWECLREGDSEGVIEVIRIYLEAVNKTEIARESSMARSTSQSNFSKTSDTSRGQALSSSPLPPSASIRPVVNLTD